MKRFLLKAKECNFRASDDFYNKIVLAENIYPFDKSQIARKAMMSFNKLDSSQYDEVFRLPDGSTLSGSHRMKFLIYERDMKGKTNTMLRSIIWWYLNLPKHTYAKAAPFVPDGVEGIHYKVKELA